MKTLTSDKWNELKMALLLGAIACGSIGFPTLVGAADTFSLLKGLALIGACGGCALLYRMLTPPGK